MQNFSIKTKLFIPLAFACILVLGVMFTNFVALKGLQKTSGELGENFLPAVSNVLNADRDLYQARLAQLEFLSATDDADRRAARAAFDENNLQAKERMSTYLSLLSEQDFVKSQFRGFDSLYRNWSERSSQFFSEPSLKGYQMLDEQFESLRDVYDKAGEAADQNAFVLRELSNKSSDRYFVLMTVASLITAGLLFLLTLFVPKFISLRINLLTDKVKDLGSGSGDLRARIEVGSNDELGKLAIQFNSLIESIANLVSGMRGGVTTFGKEVDHFFQSIEQVTKTTSDQSVALSSLAASYHQSATATVEVSGITSRTAELTNGALDSTDKGMDIIHRNSTDIKALSRDFAQTYGVADDLKQNSQQIAAVMETIRSIAEQTNLLALNAAIEAARAGEQGRGFAVVADEVRTLASRTQESTDEIDQIVTGFQDKVANVFEAIKSGCDKLAVTEAETGKAEKSFQEVKVLIDQINELSLQTAAAAEEQTAVSDEINRNITFIDDKAQQNAENMRAARLAAETFRSEAKKMVENINRFKVD